MDVQTTLRLHSSHIYQHFFLLNLSKVTYSSLSLSGSGLSCCHRLYRSIKSCKNAFLLAFLMKGCRNNSLAEGLWNKTSKTHMSQRTTKPKIRLVRPVKTQISLRIRAVSSESLLIADAFYSLRAIQRGMKLNDNICHTGWMYRLIWVFAGHTGLIVGFVMYWLIWWYMYIHTMTGFYQ